jgi:hypothetical protein
VAKAPSREEKTGRRRHESGGGEGTTRGKWEVRVAATWVRGLPNDERIQPGAKNDVGMRPGENGWIPRGYWAPKGALSGSYLFVRGPPLFPIISRLRQRRLPALRRVARSAPPRCCVRPLQGSSRAPVGYTQRPMQKAGLMAAAAAARRIQAAVLGASTAAAQRTRTALFESSSTAVGSRSLMSRDLLQRLAHKEVLLSNPFIPMVRCTTVTEVFLDRHHLRTASSCLFSPTPEACVCFCYLS